MMRFLVAFGLCADILVLMGCGGSSESGPPKVSYDQQIAQAKQEPAPDVRAKRLTNIGYQQGRRATATAPRRR